MVILSFFPATTPTSKPAAVWRQRQAFLAVLARSVELVYFPSRLVFLPRPFLVAISVPLLATDRAIIGVRAASMVFYTGALMLPRPLSRPPRPILGSLISSMAFFIIPRLRP